ncbi:MAG: hypothetical protein HPY64_06735 [Anaerolineae bacterium]|nr:hypothetical protein [Anaerolineae bacterium]
MIDLKRMATALLIGLAILSGLPEMSSPSITGQTPVTITIGTTDFPRSLDPATAVDLPSVEVLNHLYTGLTRQRPGTLDFELALAAEHRISADGLEHYFTIRSDAAFADGTPISAATFARSITRVLNLGREGADVIGRYVVSAAAEEGNVLTIRLQVPLPDIKPLLALPQFFPQHPAVYPDNSVLAVEDMLTLIGNGPYRIDSFEPDTAITLMPDPAYRGPAPANDRVVLRRYAIPIDLRRALESREVDIAWRALAEPDLAHLARDPALIRLDQPNLQTYYLLLNHTPMSISGLDSFEDPAIRQAFALLVDREASASLGLRDAVLPLYTVLPPELKADNVPFPVRDPNQADAILSEAGYRPRRRPISTALLIATDAYGDRMASAAAEIRRAIESSEIIATVAINDSLTPTFIGAINRGEYLCAIIGWRPAFASPIAYLIPLARSDSPIPAGAGYSSATVDRMLLELGLTRDEQQHAELYNAIQQEILARVDLIPLWQGKDVIVYNEAITGILLERNSWLRYDALSRQP